MFLFTPQPEFKLGEYYDQKTLSYRLKYKNLDETFPSEEYHRNQFVVFFNLDLLTSNLYRWNHKAKELNRGTEPVRQKSIKSILLGLLNSIAHYNHYFNRRFGVNATFALYYPTAISYSIHEDLCTAISQICQFVPNIHFITQIPESRPMSQAHVANALAWILSRDAKRRNRDLKIVWFQPTAIDRIASFYSNCYEVQGWNKDEAAQVRELPNLTSSDKFLKIYLKHNDAMREWWLKMPSFDRSALYVPLMVLKPTVLEPLLATKMTPNPIRRTLEFYKKIRMIRVQNAYEKLPKNPSALSVQEVQESVFLNMCVKNDQNIETIAAYQQICSLADFRERKDVISSVESFMPLWTKKLKDKSIAHSLSDFVSIDGVSLNIEWLLEGVSYG